MFKDEIARKKDEIDKKKSSQPNYLPGLDLLNHAGIA
jgi:hypothetical protein